VPDEPLEIRNRSAISQALLCQDFFKRSQGTGPVFESGYFKAAHLKDLVWIIACDHEVFPPMADAKSLGLFCFDP
jgi:hypothetical protein